MKKNKKILEKVDYLENYAQVIDLEEVARIERKHRGHHLAIVESKTTGVPHLVCHTCRESLKKYQKCEVYSRCCGYLRPTDGWNRGKRAEFEARKTYKVGLDVGGIDWERERTG